jgi:hypothetical protein
MGLCWWWVFNSPVLVGLIWTTRNLQENCKGLNWIQISSLRLTFLWNHATVMWFLYVRYCTLSDVLTTGGIKQMVTQNRSEYGRGSRVTLWAHPTHSDTDSEELRLKYRCWLRDRLLNSDILVDEMLSQFYCILTYLLNFVTQMYVLLWWGAVPRLSCGNTNVCFLRFVDIFYGLIVQLIIQLKKVITSAVTNKLVHKEIFKDFLQKEIIDLLVSFLWIRVQPRSLFVVSTL